MKALTICQPYPAIAELAADGFGHWLAGFMDGEGCFYLTKSTTGSHRCQVRIKLRADDRPILDECVRRTGCGYVVGVKSKYGPQVEWMVVRKADTARMVDIFRAFVLRAKKRRDFEIWSEAVAVMASVRHITDGASLRRGGGSLRHPAQIQLAILRKQLQDVRRKDQAA